MNRRQAIAASIGLLAFGGVRVAAAPAPGDFDPFMVWRQSARFDREVLDKIHRRLAVAMMEQIDRSWRI